MRSDGVGRRRSARHGPTVDSPHEESIMPLVPRWIGRLHRTPFLFLLIAAPLALAGAARADDGSSQLEDNLSAYVGRNAEGYLGPLRNSLGSALNSGLFMYPHVPAAGFHARLDLRGMLVNIGDDDRTFRATTDPSFGPEQEVDVPTVVGDTEGVTVMDPGSGAIYTFPGGFDIDRFGLAAPQLTIGSLQGTELLLRWARGDFGEDAQIEEIEFFGIGARHSISQWMPNLPLDVSVHVLHQSLDIDEDFIEARALTIGATGGKSFGMLAAYAGLSYDSIDLDARYEATVGGEPETVDLDLEKASTARFSLGATARLGFVHLNGEVHLSDQTSFGVGLGLGL
jgi:hypothetical protein